jgi:hypothetical protein
LGEEVDIMTSLMMVVDEGGGQMRRKKMWSKY